MSMNLKIVAEIDAVSKVGNHRIRERFDLFQTPTEITKKAIRGNPLVVYREYVLSMPRGDDIAVYAYLKDEVCQTGTEEDTYPSDHLKDLDDWIKAHDGWEIEWYEL